jgi:hypothetical protein
MTLQDVTSGRLTETVQVGPYDADLPIPMTLPSVPDANAATYSVPWWVARLMADLDTRSERITKWDAYYRGNQPLAFASTKFREAFGGRFKAFSSNFCALVVDGTRERLEVQGFRMSSKQSTTRAWRIWQGNDMDAASQVAHTEALIKSVVYALVEPGQLGADPRITIEDPLDAITVSDPRDRRQRRAGLKRWVDDVGHLVVVLYLPDLIWKFRSQSPWSRGSGTLRLSPFMPPDEEWPLPNPLGAVPLVPLLNRPRLDGAGQSEIDSVTSNQDAINKYRADALIAAEFGAYRQRWAIGIDIPVDPRTGKQIEPFKAAVDRLWVQPPPNPEDPNPPKVEFGEFSQTDLAPYQQMIESEIGAISSISRLPYHYLLGQPQAVPPSGESLKSSEAGLIAKVRTAMIHLGEGWEETIRLALRAIGDSGDRAAETIWRDPETRNEAVRTDAVLKQYQAGLITREVALEELGYSPDQVARMTAAPLIDTTGGTIQDV